MSDTNNTQTVNRGLTGGSLITFAGVCYGAWLGYPSALWMFIYAVLYGVLAICAIVTILICTMLLLTLAFLAMFAPIFIGALIVDLIYSKL